MSSLIPNTDWEGIISSYMAFAFAGTEAVQKTQAVTSLDEVSVLPLSDIGTTNTTGSIVNTTDMLRNATIAATPRSRNQSFARIEATLRSRKPFTQDNITSENHGTPSAALNSPCLSWCDGKRLIVTTSLSTPNKGGVIGTTGQMIGFSNTTNPRMGIWGLELPEVVTYTSTADNRQVVPVFFSSYLTRRGGIRESPVPFCSRRIAFDPFDYSTIILNPEVPHGISTREQSDSARNDSDIIGTSGSGNLTNTFSKTRFTSAFAPLKYVATASTAMLGSLSVYSNYAIPTEENWQSILEVFRDMTFLSVWEVFANTTVLFTNNNFSSAFHDAQLLSNLPPLGPGELGNNMAAAQVKALWDGSYSDRTGVLGLVLDGRHEITLMAVSLRSPVGTVKATSAQLFQGFRRQLDPSAPVSIFTESQEWLHNQISKFPWLSAPHESRILHRMRYGSCYPTVDFTSLLWDNQTHANTTMKGDPRIKLNLLLIVSERVS